MKAQVLFLIGLFSVFGCADKKSDPKQNAKIEKTAEAAVEQDVKNPSDFIPESFKIFEQIDGDLNKDGLQDRVIIIKGTSKDSIVEVDNQGKVDRNRRGLIVLFKHKKGYSLACKNYNCFSSENEDGGVYMPPELWLYIKRGNLYVHYAHGRYGYCRYVFGYKKSDFALIGYDSSDNNGPIVNSETSINFLTEKKRKRVNTNDEAEGGDEVFEETWEDIYVEDPLLLSEIKDFDSLDIDECYAQQ